MRYTLEVSLENGGLGVGDSPLLPSISFRHRETEKQRQRDRQRERERQRHRDTERQRQTERDTCKFRILMSIAEKSQLVVFAVILGAVGSGHHTVLRSGVEELAGQSSTTEPSLYPSVRRAPR